MKKLLASLAALIAFVGVLSFNVQYGDLRFDVDGWTVRHWDFVPVSIRLNEGCALPRSGGYPCGSTTGTTYTLSGPTSVAAINTTSTAFTVAGIGTASATITPNDSSHGGVFSPATVTLNNQSPQNFTYTPLQAGTYNIATTNSGTLTNPTPISFTTAPSIAPGYPAMTVGWAASHDGTITTAQAGDPFGGANATKIGEGTANDYHTLASSGITTVSGQNYTMSIMVHAGSGGSTRTLEAQLVDNVNFASGLDLVVDPVACTVSTGGWGGFTIASSNQRTANLGSGWCLAQVTGSINVTSAIIQLFLLNGGNETYAGDGASNLLVYGPALE